MAGLAHLCRTMIRRRKYPLVDCLGRGIETTRPRKVSAGVVSVCSITSQTEAIGWVFAFGALFVHIILNVRFPAPIARDGGLHILGSRRRQPSPYC